MEQLQHNVSSSSVKGKRTIQSISGFQVHAMKKVLAYVFNDFFVDVKLVDGKKPMFYITFLKITESEKINDFKVSFLEKNNIPFHIFYLEEEKRS